MRSDPLPQCFCEVELAPVPILISPSFFLVDVALIMLEERDPIYALSQIDP